MNKATIYKFLFLPIAYCLLLISSCTRINVFEKNMVIPKYEWQSDFSAKGSFTISDTVAEYNIYIVLRHTDAYRYNNIWLNFSSQSPGDSLREEKIDLQLGNDATGWLGTGMNDIWEVRELLYGEPRKFKRAGTYSFSIGQIMRDNPLLNIMSVGLRVEKAREAAKN